MSEKYKTRDNERAYFLTITVVGWVDVFTRPNQKQQIVNSLKYCMQHKDLIIFAWCLMSNHLHMICRADGENSLSDILRDFKTFTSKRIVELLVEEPESRRECLPAGEAGMLEYFSKACSHLKRDQKYKVWQDGNHPEEVFSSGFLYEKRHYIHNNPVNESIVENSWDYLYSSARNYTDLDGPIDVFVLDQQPLIKNWK